MVAISDAPRPKPLRRGWQRGFLKLLPAIQQYAERTFRHLPSEAREEAVQEVTANALVAYARLAVTGKLALAYPTVLARYAAAQFRAGRRVGSRINNSDVLSASAQRNGGFALERLDQFDETEGLWKERLIEDRRATPAELAITRLDFAEWLDTLPIQKRRIAEVLATGEGTQATARHFRLTPGRISQIREELRCAWDHFRLASGPHDDSVP
jgi:hypothetical protein